MKHSINDAEFRGFFYADGSASLVRYHKTYKKSDGPTSYYLYRPQISIGLRDDDLSVLKWIKNRYGGSIWVRSDHNYLGHLPNPYKIGNTKKGYVWTCTNVIICHKLCKIFLDTSIPYKKVRAVSVLYNFLDWRIKKGLRKKYTKQDRILIDNWWLECKRANSYQGGQ